MCGSYIIPSQAIKVGKDPKLWRRLSEGVGNGKGACPWYITGKEESTANFSSELRSESFVDTFRSLKAEFLYNFVSVLNSGMG